VAFYIILSMTKKLIILLFAFLLLSFNLHKIHVSLTNVVYKQEKKILQITTRLFIDDLENALSKKFNKTIELNTDRETKNIDKLINEYISENLEIKLNSNNIKLQYLGKEYEQDIVYIYFEIENTNDFSKIEVKNTCLFELFDDQRNIIKIKTKKTKKTFFLQPKHFKESLTI
jgi:hypothetical protein